MMIYYPSDVYSCVFILLVASYTVHCTDIKLSAPVLQHCESICIVHISYTQLYHLHDFCLCEVLGTYTSYK